MEELRGVDLKRACLVPSSVFASPDDVVRSQRLTLPQKFAVLRRWEFDARRVASYGDDELLEGSMLHRVRRALQTLTREHPLVRRHLGPQGTEGARVGLDTGSIGDESAVDQPTAAFPDRGALGP